MAHIQIRSLIRTLRSPIQDGSIECELWEEQWE